MKERIVLNAWEMVVRFPSLKKLNFLPSLFGMSWLFCILIYQVTYTYISLYGQKDFSLQSLFALLDGPYFITGIITVGVIFLLYLFTNPIARWGIIHMIDTYRKSGGKKFHRSWQGLFDGLSHFLPIFQIQNILGIFSPITIITSYIFLLRLFGTEYIVLISVIMGLYLIFAFLLNMCFAYAPFFVIFEEKKGIESLSASTGMAVRNINITARLYFTNLLLYIRTLLMGGLFLLLPFLASSILAYFSIQSFWAFLAIFWTLSLILFIFIVHLNSTLDIFILALWYEAYRACKEEDILFFASKSSS